MPEPQPSPHPLLTVGELASRSGFAPSALRFYERVGLISSSRTSVMAMPPMKKNTVIDSA